MMMIALRTGTRLHIHTLSSLHGPLIPVRRSCSHYSYRLPPMKTASYMPAPVSKRVSPSPVGSGISFRKLPPASHESIMASCDHWLSKAQGNYEAPSARWLFMLAHEVKALLEPLRKEHAATCARLRHLESVLLQWTEVFDPASGSGLASPAALASQLKSQQSTNAQLREALQKAHEVTAAGERRCLELLRQHHEAHAQERERERDRHAAELERLHQLHAAQLRVLSARAEA